MKFSVANELNLVSIGDSQTAKFGNIASVDQTYPMLIAKARGYGNVTNAGLSGDTAGMMATRFAASVLTHHAGAVSIMVGANDVTSGIAVATYKANVKAMVQAAQAQRCRVTVLSFPPVRTAPLLAAAPAYVTALEEIQSETDCEFLDVFGAFIALSGGELDAIYQPADDTHINAAGHAYIESLAALPGNETCFSQL